VVTKLDVLDRLAKIPVCTGYKINGKKTAEIPADARAWDRIEPQYTELPGWEKDTSKVSSYDKLPAKSREYLAFLERETGARIGMVSTGPDRDQTIFLDEFAAELKKAAAAR
jgi:adenylosuccinate synthase